MTLLFLGLSSSELLVLLLLIFVILAFRKTFKKSEIKTIKKNYITHDKKLTSLSAKHKKLLKSVKEHLDKEETIHFSVNGTYEAEMLGNETIRNGIFIATENRLIFFAEKLFGHDLEYFPFKNISSIEKSKGFMGHTISIFASGNKSKMKWIDEKNDISKFIEYVNSKIGHSESNNNKANDVINDIPSQIQKLADLKDKGILSENEFNSKKIELLAKM